MFTEDSSLVGSHTVYLWCELDDYPDVKGYAEVAVTIDPCVLISSYFSLSLLDQTYVIGMDGLKYYTYEFTQNPCDYAQTYKVT